MLYATSTENTYQRPAEWATKLTVKQTLHTLTFIVAYSYRPSTICHKHTSIERTCTGVRPKKQHLGFHGFEACEVRETYARKRLNYNGKSNMAHNHDGQANYLVFNNVCKFLCMCCVQSSTFCNFLNSCLVCNFSVLKKCNGKLECLIYEMLFIKKKRPCLNTQSDSICAKLFI